MGVLVQTLKASCEKELESITNSVYGEMKGIVGAHSRTGQALAAVGIERGAMSSFVGGRHPHLYWLNCGNGSGRITASGKALGKYPGGIPGIGWRHSVSTYDGIDFVSTIASHY